MGFGMTGAPALAALIVFAVLLAWVVWLERRRESPAGRTVRLTATLLSLTGLLFLFLRPGLRETASAEAWLITPGAERGSMAPAGGEIPLYSLVESLHAGARRIPDTAWLARHRPEITRVHVAGNGLRWWDWEEMPGTIEWEEPPEPSVGIRNLVWNRRLLLGDRLLVQGSVSTSSPGGQIELHGPEGLVDSFEWKAASSGRFTLRAAPRDTGRFLYRIALLSDRGEPIEERIDVQVVKPPTVAVLWLEASPSFETRSFKQWLAAGGHPLVIRSAVSRDRYRFEYQDHPELAVDAITRDLLRRFQLVVVDLRTLEQLEPDERRALETAVREDGLGTLLLMEKSAESTEEAFEWAGLSARDVGDLEEMTVRASWSGMRETPGLKIPARELPAGPGIVPLVRDGSGRLLAAARPSGRGIVAATVLTGAYRWVLEGNAAVHGEYWNHLLEAVARPAEEGESWELPPGPILVDQPLPIMKFGGTEAVAAGIAPGDAEPAALALRQDPMEPSRWTTTIRPAAPGWHRLITGDGDESWFYAQPDSAWPAWQQARRHEETSRRIAEQPPAPTEAPAGAESFQELSRLWSLALFLLPLFGVWVQEKRRQSWAT